MENTEKGINDNIIRPNKEINRTPDNRANGITIKQNDLPYEDPAITNPEELASFPTPAQIADAQEVKNESADHLVNRRSPVREGRNITRTDNNPDNDGFM